MPSWSSSRKPTARGSQTKTVSAVAGAVVAIIFLIGAFVEADRRNAQNATLDRETSCPKNGAQSELAVLVDRTDGLTEVQAADLEQRLLAWARSVPKFGQFKIYEVGKG